MNDVPETHYDTATLASEQLACAESLFYAIATLLEDAASQMEKKPGRIGLPLSACQHAAVLARLGSMEAGNGHEQFGDTADALKCLEAEAAGATDLEGERNQ